MANYNGDVGTYSHSDYTGLQERVYANHPIKASAANFAYFNSRNKVLVRAIHIVTTSASSLTTGSMAVQRSGVSITHKTLTSLAETGKHFTITLTASNTLHTITELMALQFPGDGKGRANITYEYQVLYPSTLIGS